MTAAEIIDQIMALPPEERAKIVKFIYEIESATPKRTMGSKTFERSAKQVFDRHDELMKKLGE